MVGQLSNKMKIKHFSNSDAMSRGRHKTYINTSVVYLESV